MKMNIWRFVLATGLFLSLATWLPVAPAALAQMMPSGGTRPSLPPASTQPAPRRDVVPGLPGAQVDEDTVAPADRLASEMRPTEALFDAINRGDITAARDAINRGAEMNARSMLGTTPLELSIDLGRNDIAFLLLSLRGADERPAPRTGTAANAKTPNHAQPARPNATRPSAVQNVRIAPAPAAPQGARLFAGDGGTPAPAVGFLGFDSGGAKPR